MQNIQRTSSRSVKVSRDKGGSGIRLIRVSVDSKVGVKTLRKAAPQKKVAVIAAKSLRNFTSWVLVPFQLLPPLTSSLHCTYILGPNLSSALSLVARLPHFERLYLLSR